MLRSLKKIQSKEILPDCVPLVFYFLFEGANKLLGTVKLWGLRSVYNSKSAKLPELCKCLLAGVIASSVHEEYGSLEIVASHFLELLDNRSHELGKGVAVGVGLCYSELNKPLFGNSNNTAIGLLEPGLWQPGVVVLFAVVVVIHCVITDLEFVHENNFEV